MLLLLEINPKKTKNNDAQIGGIPATRISRNGMSIVIINRKMKGLKKLPRPPNNFSGLDCSGTTPRQEDQSFPDIIVHKRI